MRSLFLFPALLLVITACSSTQEKTAPASEAPVTEAKAVQKSWEQLEGKEKGAFMKEVVLPTMGALLQKQDPEEFAEVTCKTCHGKDPKAVHFEMPSPELPKLNPADMFAEHKAHDAEMVTFMMEVFTPKMVEVLGVEGYDPETHTGFGCFSCHTMKDAPAATPAAEPAAAPVEAP